MRVFISYHREDTEYRRKLEKILQNHKIEYYAVPEDADFNGKNAEFIRNFICNKLKKCNILICLIGMETYKRPHVDREIHTALKGKQGKRLGIIGVLLPTRNDTLNSVDLCTLSKKLYDNKNYVVWSEWRKLKQCIDELINIAFMRSNDKSFQTDHSNPCMPLKQKIYYDN